MPVTESQAREITALADGTRTYREISIILGISSKWLVRDYITKHRSEGLRCSAPRPASLHKARATVSPRVAAKFAAAANGDPDGVGLMDLCASTCRWPLGSIDQPAERFCGRMPKDKSAYCDHHHAAAYEATKFRLRRPMWA